MIKETIGNIIKKAYEEGYYIEEKKWMNSEERFSGSPSSTRALLYGDMFNADGMDEVLNLPSDDSQNGCTEWNIINDKGEYYCLYHVERGRGHLCCDALEAFCCCEMESGKLEYGIVELKSMRRKLLERVEEYEDAYRFSGHPSIINRIDALHEAIGMVQERVFELSPSDCDWRN